MALTDTENLYNLALGLIGEYEAEEGKTTTKQYSLCQRFYSLARDEVLAMHPWNEAIKQAMILQSGTEPLYDYAYQYSLPSDCLRVLSIGTDTTDWQIIGGYVVTNYTASPEEYDSGGIDYAAGQYISYNDVTYLVNTSFTSSDWTTDLAAYLTSQAGDYGYIKLTYVYQLTTVSSFSAKLKNAIAYKLAIKIAVALTNDLKISNNLTEVFERLVMPQARSLDAQQGRLRTYYNSQWIRSRS